MMMPTNTAADVRNAFHARALVLSNTCYCQGDGLECVISFMCGEHPCPACDNRPVPPPSPQMNAFTVAAVENLEYSSFAVTVSREAVELRLRCAYNAEFIDNWAALVFASFVVPLPHLQLPDRERWEGDSVPHSYVRIGCSVVNGVAVVNIEKNRDCPHPIPAMLPGEVFCCLPLTAAHHDQGWGANYQINQVAWQLSDMNLS